MLSIASGKDQSTNYLIHFDEFKEREGIHIMWAYFSCRNDVKEEGIYHMWTN